MLAAAIRLVSHMWLLRPISVALVVSLSASFCNAQSYSCQADVFVSDAFAKTPIIWAPDHGKYVRLWSPSKDTDTDDAVFKLSIYSERRELKTITLRDLSAGTFVKWSPDSKAFYVMWSSGGAVGDYHVRVFFVAGEKAVESPAPTRVAADFAKHHYCKARGNNLFAIRWVNGSERILLQPQIYPASDCRQMGFTVSYLANTADGEILEHSPAKQIVSEDGCPSNVFPTAFVTQKEVDDYRASSAQKSHR